jgi:hypothetical protein
MLSEVARVMPCDGMQRSTTVVFCLVRVCPESSKSHGRVQQYYQQSKKEEEDSLIFKFPATNSKEMSIVEIRRVFKYLNPVLTTCIYLSSVFRVMS